MATEGPGRCAPPIRLDRARKRGDDQVLSVATVVVAHGQSVGGKTQTHWRFNYGDGTSLNIAGFADDDQPTARIGLRVPIAERLGWDVGRV